MPALSVGKTLWGEKNAGLIRTEDRAKIEENSMIQTTRVPSVESVEVETIGDMGKTADRLEALSWFTMHSLQPSYFASNKKYRTISVSDNFLLQLA